MAEHLVVIRAPERPGESYPWIQGHEHTHAVATVADAALCGVAVKRWITLETWQVSCPACRAAQGLGPLRLKRGDFQWKLFLDYG